MLTNCCVSSQGISLQKPLQNIGWVNMGALILFIKIGKYIQERKYILKQNIYQRKKFQNTQLPYDLNG